jgi:hypothetical protein
MQKIKVSEIQGGKKCCLCGVSPGHAGKDAASVRERCRTLKIFCEFKKQRMQMKIDRLYPK